MHCFNFQMLMIVCITALLFPVYEAIIENILNKKNSLEFKFQMLACLFLISFSTSYLVINFGR